MGQVMSLRQNSGRRVATARSLVAIVAMLALIAIALPAFSQTKSNLETFFRRDIGLSEEEIQAIQSGQPVAKTLPPRTPAEVFLFGAVYIHSAPEKYLQFAHDFDRMGKLPNYLALGVVSTPPQIYDFKKFSFDSDDIQALKDCKPGDCAIQLPASSIEALQRSVNWSAPDANDQVNQYLQKIALQRLLEYQREGDKVLGVYNDKHNPTNVPEQFAYMLAYSKALPERLPDFYHYLLAYPDAKPANVEDTFYWAKVKFGLKPTLRLVQMVTMRGNSSDQLAYAIAEKQLYSSHYFETALDLSFCVRGTDDSRQPGFYLIRSMGSEQAGLTGPKGSIVRKEAVGRSVSNLRKALTTIKNTLETKQ